MAATGNKRNYSILVGIELDTSDVQKQLDEIKGRDIKVKIDVEGNEKLETTAETMAKLPKRSKTIKAHVDKASKSIKYMGLTFQQANDIMQKSIHIIGNMLDSVFELDDALVDFQKVSELSGASLDAYVDKLTQMGLEVGRTGKPKGQSRNVQMVNVH